MRFLRYPTKNWQYILVLFFIFVGFLSIVYKLYLIQIIKDVSAEKLNSLNGIKIIPPLRGNIFLTDKDGNLLPAAVSYYLYDVYYYPVKAKNSDKELEEINKIIKIDNLEEVKNKAKNSSKTFILAKEIDTFKKDKISALNYDSVFFEEKVIRRYPLNEILATVIGFASFDDKTGQLEGKYGLEKYYNEILKGEVGYRDNVRLIRAPKKGADLVLNIDYYVERKTFEILKNALEEFNAEGGLIVVVDVKSGKILAASELPSYNPNFYFSEKDYSIFISRLSKTYEPGSVMKPFFYAAAFNENLAKPEDVYNDQGYVILNGWRIENFDKKARGSVDLKTALEQSLNTGSVYISQLLGKTKFLRYIKIFHLDSKPEVDFPILENHNFSNLKDPGREVNFGTASFGQGISISPLGLMQSFNLFPNNGQIISFNFVKKIIYFDNSEKDINSRNIDKVLNQKSLNEILPILEGVVENQAKKAKVKGFRIAGKTGSALLPYSKENTNGIFGYSDEVITNFIGFFPVSNPKFLVLVRLDKPAKSLLAFGTAAPTFKKVAEFLISYYNLDPDKIEEVLKNIN